MADEVDNLILEHLRHIRARVDVMSLDLENVKLRVSALEQSAGQMLILMGALNSRMDRFDERLGRIERRLDLVEV